MDKFFFSLMLLGAASNGSQMPFWEYSNQFDLMPRTSGYVTLLDAGMESDASREVQFNCGTTLALRGDAFDRAAFVPGQVYAGIKWKPLSLDLGLKNPELLYFGADNSLGSLSSTSGNLIMSGNARNMPGYTITLDPLGVPFTNNHLQIYGKYGDYLMTDERVEGRLLCHNTQIFLRMNAGRFTFGLGLDHWAQWEGNGFANYLRVITGSHGGADSGFGDRINVIGNQLGAEKFFLNYRGDDWEIEIRHDIPYDDKSGMRFTNFPDGMNYLVFSFKDKDRWMSDVVFEYDYTMYQSGPIHESEVDENGNHVPWQKGMNYFGMDNYFNNTAQMISGWTHHAMTIGTPLFYPKGTREGTWDRNSICQGVENNRIKAVHLGISGKIARLLPYRLMATYSRCFGTYSASYIGESPASKPWGSVTESSLKQLSLGLNFEIPLLGKNLVILPGAYLDRGEVLPNSFGATLGLKYLIDR